MLWTEPKSLTVPSLAPALTNRLRIVANASGDADSATDDLFKAEVAAARAQSYATRMRLLHRAPAGPSRTRRPRCTPGVDHAVERHLRALLAPSAPLWTSTTGP